MDQGQFSPAGIEKGEFRRCLLGSFAEDGTPGERFFENMDGGRFRLAGKDPGLGGQGNKAVYSFHSFQI